MRSNIGLVPAAAVAGCPLFGSLLFFYSSLFYRRKISYVYYITRFRRRKNCLFLVLLGGRTHSKLLPANFVFVCVSYVWSIYTFVCEFFSCCCCCCSLTSLVVFFTAVKLQFFCCVSIIWNKNREFFISLSNFRVIVLHVGCVYVFVCPLPNVIVVFHNTIKAFFVFLL